MTEDTDREPDDPERPLCPGCLEPNEPDADFCSACGCPLSSMAATDPLRRAYAQGFWFRTAASGRIKPIVFWGTWLLLGPTAVISLLVVVQRILDDSDGTAVGMAVVGGLGLALSVLLVRMTRGYLRQRDDEAGDPGDDDDERSDE